MKKIYTLLTIALCSVLTMQAEMRPITGELKEFKPKVKLDTKKQMNKMSKAPVAKAVASASELVGTYDAFAKSAFQGQPNEEWVIEITADATDANKVWIHPIEIFGGLTAAEISPVYATYDATKGALSLPMGQTLFKVEGKYNMILGRSTDGSKIDTAGSLTLTVSADGQSITFDNSYILGVGNAIGNEWWYQALYDIKLTKQSSAPKVYLHMKDGSEPYYVQAENLYFETVNGEMCIATAKEMNKLEGTYAAYAPSAFEGEPDENWTITVTRDSADAKKIWIQPVIMIPGLAATGVNPVYAIYDDESSQWMIELGQCLYGGAGQKYNLILAGTDNGSTLYSSGYVPLYVEDGYIAFPEVIIGAYNSTGVAANDGWYQALYMIEYLKGSYLPLNELEKITRKQP